MKALEVSGHIDEQRRLHLDAPLDTSPAAQVRVIVLIPDDDDIGESDWLRSAAANPAFEFLRDPEEDIYSPQDGEPVRDER